MMKTLNLNDTEVKVLLDSLNAVGSKKHPEYRWRTVLFRLAYETVFQKLKALAAEERDA